MLVNKRIGAAVAAVRPESSSRLVATVVLLPALAGLLLAGCSAPPAQPAGPAQPSATASAPTESKTLTVITHDSFALADATIAEKFGITVGNLQVIRNRAKHILRTALAPLLAEAMGAV